jgi:hypothetical protein
VEVSFLPHAIIIEGVIGEIETLDGIDTLAAAVGRNAPHHGSCSEAALPLWLSGVSLLPENPEFTLFGDRFALD